MSWLAGWPTRKWAMHSVSERLMGRNQLEPPAGPSAAHLSWVGHKHGGTERPRHSNDTARGQSLRVFAFA